MIPILFWSVAAAAILLLADRALLWFETRGWIYYRRYGLHRGASTYHLLEMSSVFDPGFKEIMEVKTEEQEQQDEAGDPPTDPDLLDREPLDPAR